MFSNDQRTAAAKLLDTCRTKNIKLATAESCTGGLLAALLTEIPGSSDVVERGFVTYSNEAKVELLGVLEATLAACGAVSEETACAMAEGALRQSRAALALSITGIAGPGGGSSQKPVGLVHIACALKGRDTRHERHVFPGSRAEIRLAAVEAALALMQAQAALLP